MEFIDLRKGFEEDVLTMRECTLIIVPSALFGAAYIGMVTYEKTKKRQGQHIVER